MERCELTKVEMTKDRVDHKPTVFVSVVSIIHSCKHASQISFKRALLIGQRTTQATTANHSQDFREKRFPVVLNFHRERWNPVKKHSKALVFFTVSKQIPIVYSAEKNIVTVFMAFSCLVNTHIFT